MRDFIEADQRKSIVVGIAEAREDAAPDGGLLTEQHRRGVDALRLGLAGCVVFDATQARGVEKTHTAFGPLHKFCKHIFGDEHHLRRTPYELGLRSFWFWRDQRQNRGAIGRRYGYPAVAVLQFGIECEVKPQLIQIEAQAAVLVAHIHIHAVHPQVRILRRA